MRKDANVIGRIVAYLRNQHGWSQNDLVTQLHLLGNINMTREILANIETQRSVATCKQIEFFAEVFGIKEQALFPKQRHFIGKEAGSNLRIFTRKSSPDRLCQGQRRLALCPQTD
jgi:transcriptional regulator with XRE-family HTH domain